MEFILLECSRFPELRKLHTAYKAAIGEEAPSTGELFQLEAAIEAGNILFYGCLMEDALVAICSVSRVFTTFNYQPGGILEDFYIAPEHRHKGIARRLVAYAFEQSKVASLTVGCADCDLEMYKAIGFQIPLGHMLAYEYSGEAK
jgi:GNAT superfamily N-acetyltransferase